MNYYKRYETALNMFYKNIDDICASHAGKDFIVFGTSRISGMIVSYLKEKNIKVFCMVDNDKARQGKTAFECFVYAPDMILTPYKKNRIILIASSHQNEMIRQLEKMGYTNHEEIIKVIDMPQVMNDFTYEDRAGYKIMSQEDIRKCQLGILDELHRICEDNGLKYYLSGGTLLGAVRHGGYIPWDDDIDVVMGIEDMKQLSEILKTNNRYKLVSMFDEELDYFDECSLMIDSDTVMDMNRFPMQSITGVSIDIFVLSGVPEGDKGIEHILEAKDLEIACYNSLYAPKEHKRNVDKLIRCLEKYSYTDAPRSGAILGRHFFNEILCGDDYRTGVMVEFEGRNLWTLKGYVNYLTQIYGDYMTLPPVEQRKPHHYFNAYWKY